MEERGLLAAAAHRLTLLVTVIGLVPLSAGLAALRWLGGSGSGDLGGRGWWIGLGGGCLAAAAMTLLVTTALRTRLPLDLVAGDDLPANQQVHTAGRPSAVVDAVPLVGSIRAMNEEANLAGLLNLISARLELLGGKQVATLTGAGEAREAGDDAGAEGAGVRSSLGRGDIARLHRAALRVERVAASLRILAGDQLGPRPGPSRPMSGVVARALAACEERSRVDCSSIEEVAVGGEAAADLALVLAELVDNALAGAEPRSTVAVIGRCSGDGYSLAVVDEGAELDAGLRERLNREMIAPPSLAVNPPSSFGLPVVGRLALRHGLEVRLLEAATEGVIAKVRVPAGLLGGVVDTASHRSRPSMPALRRTAATEAAAEEAALDALLPLQAAAPALLSPWTARG